MYLPQSSYLGFYQFKYQQLYCISPFYTAFFIQCIWEHFTGQLITWRRVTAVLQAAALPSPCRICVAVISFVPLLMGTRAGIAALSPLLPARKGLPALRRARGEEGAQHGGPRGGCRTPPITPSSLKRCCLLAGFWVLLLGGILMVPMFFLKIRTKQNISKPPHAMKAVFASAGMLKLLHFPFGNWVPPVLFSVLFCNPNTQSPQSISASLTF